MTAQRETRHSRVPVEVRDRSDAGVRIGGTAVAWMKLSRNLGGFVERFARTAFASSEGNGWPGVVARYQHDDMAVLGTTDGGTLTVSTDDDGLLYDVLLPDTSVGRDVAVLAGRGDVRASSFAFAVHPDGDEWGVTDQGFPLRTITSAGLYDVAPVTTPAYPDSTADLRQVALRSLARHIGADPDDVTRLAQENRLASLFAARAVIVDIASAPAPSSGGRTPLSRTAAAHKNRRQSPSGETYQVG